MAEETVTYPEGLTLLTLEDDALTEKEAASVFTMGGEDEQEEIADMLAEAAEAARPKYLYRLSAVEEKTETGVTVEGVHVESPLMRRNFDPVGRVFPYVATCGAELEAWAAGYADDPLAEYWCEEIRKLYLGHAVRAGRDYVLRTHGITSRLSAMNPGSITDWPLPGQRELFAMLGRERVLQYAGVRLTDSMLMLPSKSVSGIGFETETPYENCSRCPILRCPNRRAQPDADVETR